MNRVDVIVLGVGGVGAATIDYLARQGVRVLGIEAHAAGHSLGSSHGQTRLFRTAYFEHEDYVPLLLRAGELWEELERDAGERLFHRVGILQIGPESGSVVQGILRSARSHSLAVEQLDANEIARRFKGFLTPAGMVGVFEASAGVLLVERTITALVGRARRHGATVLSGERVIDWSATNGEIRVRTQRGAYAADRLIVSAGAMAAELLRDLALPIEVLRKPSYWVRPRERGFSIREGWPGFLYELPEGQFYGAPSIDGRGVKVAEHTGGTLVSDPRQVDRGDRAEDRERVDGFLRKAIPSALGEWTGYSVCLYTVTPDRHFIVDRHPDHPNVWFAAGLSGHGYKFAPVLGEILGDRVLERDSPHRIDFLSRTRPGLATSNASPTE